MLNEKARGLLDLFSLVIVRTFRFQYKHTSFYCTSLYCTAQILHFLQIEDKTLQQQKDYYNLLYCDTRFIAVVWNWTLNISEICLYMLLSCIEKNDRGNCRNNMKPSISPCLWPLLRFGYQQHLCLKQNYVKEETAVIGANKQNPILIHSGFLCNPELTIINFLYCLIRGSMFICLKQTRIFSFL